MNKVFGWMAAIALLAGGCSGARDWATTREGALPAPALPLAIAPGGLPAFFQCALREKATLVSAHRGGPEDGFPENAIETIADSLADAALLVEIDIATTADGQLALMHDDTLDRTTTGTGPIAAQTLQSVQSYALEDADGDDTAFRAPSLAEALAFIKGRSIAQLDIKRPTTIADILRVVEEVGAEDHVVLLANTAENAILAHRINPRLMVSVGVRSADELDAMAAQGVDLTRVIVWTGTRAPNPALNAALAARNIPVSFGTLGRNGVDIEIERSGDVARYQAIADQGVAIIASDRPEIAARALDDQARIGACVAAQAR